MLNKLILIFLVSTINLLHLYIPGKVFNNNFDPYLSLLAFGIFFGLVAFISSLKKDWTYVSILGISLTIQVYSFFKNGGGVPDYINLGFFDTNIPDFFITLTILTWWYYRVYKQPRFIPAEIEQDVT